MHSAHISLLVYLLGFLLLTARAHAQPPAEARTASLHVAVDARGNAALRLELSFKPAEAIALADSLSEGLHKGLREIDTEATSDGWILRAQCEKAFLRQGFHCTGTINLDPLCEVLSKERAKGLLLTVTLPPVGFAECSEPTIPDRLPSEKDRTFQLDISRNRPGIPIHLTFGYAPLDLLRLVPLAILLPIPLAAGAWIRHKAIPSDGDPFEAWFGCWRFQRQFNLAFACIWFAAFPILNAREMIAFAAGLSSGGQQRALALLLAATPCLALAASGILATPAFIRLPGMGWTSQYVRWRGYRGHLILALFLLCAGMVSLAFNSDLLVSGLVLSTFLFLMAYIELAGRLRTLTHASTAMPRGETRERFAALCKRASIRVPELRLIPPGHWRLLNALTSFGLAIHLTPPLIQQLNNGELDAVPANQIRFYQRRAEQIVRGSFLLILTNCISGIFLSILSAPLGYDPTRWIPILASVPFLVVTLFGFGLWRFGPNLDLPTSNLTEEPEAWLSALAKLYRLRLLPEHGTWPLPKPAADEAFNSRLRELATQTAIDGEMMEELLVPSESITARPPKQTQSAEGTTADQTLDAATNREFTREFRLQTYAWLGWTVWVMTAFISVLAAVLVQRTHLPAVPAVMVYLAALVFLVALDGGLIGPMFACLGLRRLARSLRAKFEREGIPVSAAEGGLVGLSPGSKLLNFEGFPDWDVGFCSWIVKGSVTSENSCSSRFIAIKSTLSTLACGCRHGGTYADFGSFGTMKPVREEHFIFNCVATRHSAMGIAQRLKVRNGSLHGGRQRRSARLASVICPRPGLRHFPKWRE
jgi:hypothetical protein